MADITVETLRGWSGAQMRAALGSPDRQKVLDIIQNLNMEQAAQIQEQQTKNELAALGGEDNAEALAAEAAKAAAAIEAARKAEETARPKKFVLDYRVTDDDGNPIGRP